MAHLQLLARTPLDSVEGIAISFALALGYDFIVWGEPPLGWTEGKTRENHLDGGRILRPTCMLLLLTS